MQTRFIKVALLAATLAAGTAAQAQDRHDNDRRGNDRDRYEQRDRNDARDRRDDHGPDRYADGRRNDRNDDRSNYRHDDRGDRNRGAGPRHDLRRGGRLPGEYRNRQYVVDNWREHRLSAPPRGHHWVQAGNDYVLTAIATGVIANIILGN